MKHLNSWEQQFVIFIAVVMLAIIFPTRAHAVSYYSDERAIYEEGVRDGERASDHMIYESHFKDVLRSPGLEPALPSFWDACMKANPKLNTVNMDMFTRLYACVAWDYLGGKIKIIAGWRSQAEHDRNLKAGTSKVKRSIHQDGMAFDWTWCKNKKCTKVVGGKVNKNDYNQLIYTSGQIIGLQKFMGYFYRGFYRARDRVCSTGGDWNCDADIQGHWYDWWHIQCPTYDIAKNYECKREPHPLDYL